MKKLHNHQSVVVIFLTGFLIFCSSTGFANEKQNPAEICLVTATSKTTRTITYYKDKTITVPRNINRIACGWQAQNSVLAMLGYGDKIVATDVIIKACPNFRKFVPSIKNAILCFLPSGEFNTEGILFTKPDLVFLSSNSFARQRLQEMGIPVASLKGNSLTNMVDRAVITGQILGDDAYRRALQYVEYYNDNVQRVTRRISKIPHTQRLRVYHSRDTNLFLTAGAPSIVQDWMDMAGAINIAKNWNLGASGKCNVSIEQIITTDPDVIVCDSFVDTQTIKTDPRWKVISAVKDGKVYVNPKGIYFWGHNTTEEALQFLWLAKTLYPTHFQDIDMAHETRYFYKKFYGYDLSNQDVQTFLYPK